MNGRRFKRQGLGWGKGQALRVLVVVWHNGSWRLNALPWVKLSMPIGRTMSMSSKFSELRKPGSEDEKSHGFDAWEKNNVATIEDIG